ncbi:MAG: hypothetical protein EOP52_09940 [Sphingobacteriales bacterium]|nr:MAG: hypothetical protein EOP52_09940 [Sphingobacteriales bacterium]
MLDVFLIVALVFTNVNLARRKGKNPLVWGILSLVAFFVTAILFGGLYMAAGYQGPLDQQALREYMQAFSQDFTKSLLVLMFGVGGGLIVHYYLSRQPDAQLNDSASEEDY